MALRRLPALLLAALLAGGSSRGRGRSSPPLAPRGEEGLPRQALGRRGRRAPAPPRARGRARARGRPPEDPSPPITSTRPRSPGSRRTRPARARSSRATSSSSPRPRSIPGTYPKSYCIFFDAQRTAAERRNPAPPPPHGLRGPRDDAARRRRRSPSTRATRVAGLGGRVSPDRSGEEGLRGARRRRRATRMGLPLLEEVRPGPRDARERVRGRSSTAASSTPRRTSRRRRARLALGPRPRPPRPRARRRTSGRSPLLQSERPDDVPEDDRSRDRLAARREAPRIRARPDDVPRRRDARRHRGRGRDLVPTERTGFPKGVPFQELQFRFLSKKGYGDAVFQKDAREMISPPEGRRASSAPGS